MALFTISKTEDVENEWRLTDHTASAGLTHGQMWLTGARRALQDAQQGGPVMWGLWLGVLHFVHCLHHFRKCVLMAAANVAEDVAADIKDDVARFDEAVPDLTTIRHVLEHYEDGYALGKGDKQQPEIKDRSSRQLDGDLSTQWRAVPSYDRGDTQRPVLRVAQYELDLVAALAAADHLKWALWERVREI